MKFNGAFKPKRKLADRFPHNGIGSRLRDYRLDHRLTYRKLRILIGGSISLATLYRAEHRFNLHDTTVRELERFLQGVTARVA